MLLNRLVIVWAATHTAAQGTLGDRTTIEKSMEHDYIVIGGGTAGAAVATRLSLELPASNILLIEAGPAALDDDRINIPGMVWPANRGKVLEGSSALNFMTWDRATVAEFDSWEALGNPGWNWENMLAHMIKSENFTRVNPQEYKNVDVGSFGPINAVINRVRPDFQDDGLRHSRTWASKGTTHRLQATPSAATAYTPKAGPNLSLELETRVAKIIFEPEGTEFRATGVELADGAVIRARHEVILSAGSLQSPGLLELSKIGQKSVLDAVGVEQLVDLPGVGESLQDHVKIQTSYQLKSGYVTPDILNVNATYAAEQLALYRQGLTSLYDYTGSAFSFLNWQQVVGNDNKTKVGYLSDYSITQFEVILSAGYLGTKGHPATGSLLYGQMFVTLITTLMHSLAKGSVHIASANISESPVIDPRYLSTEYDTRATMAAIKFVREIAQTEPLAGVWVSEYEPGLDAVETDDQWREYAKNATLSIWHPVGSCAMLPREDGGVVDARLKVHGTKNVRMIDGSIMRVQPSAHLQAAIYGIAEMGADYVVQQAQR
ncbi:hypothetical protein F5Y15DRAFT_423289 [Xylariaceae sp. FL0016]|nr:hypothetical protein F5Y15DRAFT_423289 [Xylariaceae sp. FL0016]